MRIEQVGPMLGNSSLSLDGTVQSVAGKALCVAISNDGARAYFGGHSGIWRSDDGGVSWWHPERPQPALNQPSPGALVVPNAYDVAISPAGDDIVFAATGNDARSPQQDGVYRSTDGAQSWTLVHQVSRQLGGPAPTIFPISQIAIAPDDANTIFAAAGACVLISSDGGNTWKETQPTPSNSQDAFWHVATGPRFGAERWVYVVGSRVWFSRDGGDTWSQDTVAASRGLSLGPATVVGVSARALSVHPTDPHIVYLTMSDFSIWFGTYQELPVGATSWSQLASTPVIPNGPTDSGGNFVIPVVTHDNQSFVISADRRTVHISHNLPFSTSAWTRLEDGNCHVDPHGLAFTPDFVPAIASGSPSTRGRAILVNDGGAYLSTDGGHSWTRGKDIATLNVINVSVNSLGATSAPTLSFGGGDNAGFASNDGGQHWRTQDYDGGDNDCSFSDPEQPTRAIVFAPRAEGPNSIFREIFLYISGGSGPPNLAWGTGDRHSIPGPVNLPLSDPKARKRAGWNCESAYFAFGYRPLVLGVPGEAPLADGDLIIIRFTPNAAFVMRTWKLSQISSADDWASTATADGPNVKSFQVGPPLPLADAAIVQASGGHAAPVFYVSDVIHGTTDRLPLGQMRLWKWTAGLPSWVQIVPPPPPVVVQTAAAPPPPPIAVAPQEAQRFFVDPYRPSLLYVLSKSHVFRSDTGGQSWVIDMSLENQLTQGGRFPKVIPFDESPEDALLRDMQFDPRRPGTRFAAGPAGVFATYDGVNWGPMVVAEPIGLRTNSIAYDYRSCPRVVYVSTLNSGLLRLGPIPPDWDYPMNSLQAAQGLITLLRVHDLGTGFGPPDDVLDGEVIVLLDTEPEKAFGFKLRSDADQPDAVGKLRELRDAFNYNRRVRLEFLRTGCRTGQIIRVISQH
jgi:hypothetical protein